MTSFVDWVRAITFAAAGLLMIGFQQVADAADAAPKTLRVYYIGNSVTDIIGYKDLVKLAAARKNTVVWGRQMIPGAPLSWLFTHPAEGFNEKPFGLPTQAFADFEWDVISLQPFDRQLHGGTPEKPDGDVDIIQNYINMSIKKSPNVQYYIYSRWPRMTRDGKGYAFDKQAFKSTEGKVDLEKLGAYDDYTDRWEKKFDGSYNLTNESRDYFEKVLLEVRKNNPTLKKTPLLVPVGDVMNELHKRMKAGEIAGYKSIYEIYADPIHLNNWGRFVAGMTYYATMFKENPTGLPSAAYGVENPVLTKAIQQTIWKVVSENPYTGVKK